MILFEHTEEERDSLINVMVECGVKTELFLDVLSMIGGHSRPYVIVGLDYTLSIPFKDLPLHINSDKRVMKAIALWRLKIGR